MLREAKAEIREKYARLPFMDWFRREPRPEKAPGVELEKNDVPAMILAALSLVIPWVLGIGVVLGLLVWLLRWAMG